MATHKDLFNHNIEQINKLNIASGSMFKALIMALQDNGNTYIRYSDAQADGHQLSYSLVEGDNDLVIEVAQALGIMFNNNTLVCHHD